MIDAKKLAKAIDASKPYHSMYGTGAALEHIMLIIAAAEAHLSTLPKPCWKIRVWRGEGESFECFEYEERSVMLECVGLVSVRARKIVIEAP